MIKTKENKGITLIALIITIIVMLILVGVTVNVALNGGLFSTAKTAVTKTNRAVEEEKVMQTEIAIELDKEEILKQFPLGEIRITSNTDPGMEISNTNIFDAFEYVLEKYYDTSSSELDLTTAIRAMNNMCQIYNSEVQHIETRGRNYWELFAYIDNFPADGEYTDEEIEKYQIINYQMQVAYGFSESYSDRRNDDYDILTRFKDNNEYVILAVKTDQKTIGNTIADEKNMADDEAKELYNTVYPGGSFPFDKMKGTTSSDFEGFIGDSKGEIVKIDSTNKNNYDMTLCGERTDFFAYVSEKFKNSDEKIVAFPCHNILLIDTKLGEIYYIDDNGNSDKPLP